MTEFSHHYLWLGETLDAIDKASRKGVDARMRAILESGRRTCDAILKQNAASELAKETIAKIDALLSGAPATQPAPSPVDNIARGMNEYAPITDEELRLEEKIMRFEERFLAYGEKKFLPLVRDLPGTNPQELGLKNALSYPFDAVRANATNPLRNVAAVKRVAKKHGTLWNAPLLQMRDPRHFGYNMLPSNSSVNAAGYAPLGRMMAFDERIDFSNDMDMMIVLHECLHIPQMNARLMRTPEWFLQFYNVQHPRVIANDEYQAYGLELEGIDLVTGGTLKKAARKKKSVDRDELMCALGARPDQRMMVEMLCQFGEKFFPDGDAVSNKYPKEYTDAIKRMCAHDGYEVFELDATNRLQIV